jgi:hypothetical protein
MPSRPTREGILPSAEVEAECRGWSTPVGAIGYSQDSRFGSAILYYGRICGRILAWAMGLVVAMLSVTGGNIWWRKRCTGEAL